MLAECRNETHYLREDLTDYSQSMETVASSDTNQFRVTLGVARLNSLSEEEAGSNLQRCCGSSRWVQQMIARRPFQSDEELFRIADELWQSLSESDWKEAFAHHPKIGDVESIRKRFGATGQWASGEQAGVQTATEEVLRGLAEENRRYEEKFDYIFIVCATGKSAGEMLNLLKERMNNNGSTEIKVAAAEQMKITRIRLAKVLGT